MIGRSDDRHIHYHTDNKVGFEWLFLCFMAKELLSGYRAPTRQQRQTAAKWTPALGARPCALPFYPHRTLPTSVCWRAKTI